MSNNEINIETYVGPVQWHPDGTKAYIKCPGEHLHTSRTGTKDTLIFLEGVPTVFCLHQHCADFLQNEVNTNLRKALDAAGWEFPEMTEDRKEYAAQQDAYTAAKERLTKSVQDIEEGFRWTQEEIELEGKGGGWADLLRLYGEDDLLWTGEPFDFGAHCFNSVKHLTAQAYAGRMPAGQFVCPNPFQPRTKRRTADRIAKRKFIVVEVDDAFPSDKQRNKDYCGALFRWLMEEHGLELAAVIDSGNKSLHGWFYAPEPAMIEWVMKVLPGAGADPATMRATQPVRMPSKKRNDNGEDQRLLWISL